MALKPPPPRLSEVILTILAELDEFIAYPQSIKQTLNWDRQQYFRAQARQKAEFKRERKRVKKAVWALVKSNQAVKVKNKDYYQLSKKGWLRAGWVASKHYQSKRQNKSKSLMIVIFDIPESWGHSRELFRKCLVNLGFDHVQRSVFLTKDSMAFDIANKIVKQSKMKPFVRFGVLKSWK